MPKGITTYGTTLKWGTTAAAMSKEIDIKSMPALGGPPQLVDITTFKDEVRSYLSGTQNINALEFTSNFTATAYGTANGDAGKPLYYELSFGTEAIFAWQGSHVCWPDGGTVDSPVDMILSIAPTTAPTLKS